MAYTCHHDPNTVFFRHLLGDLYGSPNNYTHTSGCEQDRRAACLTLFGHVFPMHDFANSRYVILWGMNNLGANQGLWESRALIDAKKKGCKLVVVDPNFTETAQKANEWVPIRPGTDGAMALAMCRVIVDDELYDQRVRRRAIARASRAFATTCAKGLHARLGELRSAACRRRQIARLAREFAKTKPAMSAIFKGSGYYTNGADAGRACYILNALCGEVDKPGNLHLKDWAPLAAPVVIPEAAKTTAAASRPCTSPWAIRWRRTCRTARLPDAVIDGKPYPVKALFVQSTNPVMSDPNRDRVQEMFRHLELGVAIELFMSETALECDIVLPETSFYEHAEIRNGMWLGAEVILCQPAVPPVGEAKPLYDIVKGIASKMGWGQHFPYEKWEDWGELVLKDIPMSLEELKKKGFWAGPVRYNRVPEGLATPSGKVRDPLPGLRRRRLRPVSRSTRERTVIPDDEFPLQLTHSKFSMHCNIVTQNNPYLMEICGENWVEINASRRRQIWHCGRRLMHRGVAEGQASASRPRSSRDWFPAASASATATASDTGRWDRSPRARARTPTI